MQYIYSWNVNSVRSRLPHIQKFIKDCNPDILMLQELKVQDHDFPISQFEEMGYNCYIIGQKSYNGVAIISKEKATNIITELPNIKKYCEEEHARFISIEINDINYICTYCPNGNPVGSQKFKYKLNFMRALCDYLETLRKARKPFIIGGDFNIAPTNLDISSKYKDSDDAIITKEAKDYYFEITNNLNLIDSFRTFNNKSEIFSWWDYRNNNFNKNVGMRIDFIFVSPEIARFLCSAGIYTKSREWEKPSDHAPVWIKTLDIKI